MFPNPPLFGLGSGSLLPHLAFGKAPVTCVLPPLPLGFKAEGERVPVCLPIRMQARLERLEGEVAFLPEQVSELRALLRVGENDGYDLGASKTATRGRPRVQHLKIIDGAAIRLLSQVYASTARSQPLFPLTASAYRYRWNKLLRWLHLGPELRLTPGGLRRWKLTGEALPSLRFSGECASNTYILWSFISKSLERFQRSGFGQFDLFESACRRCCLRFPGSTVSIVP